MASSFSESVMNEFTSKAQVVGGAFQDGEGNVLSNGYLILEQTKTRTVNGTGQICSGIEAKLLRLNS